jgi:hypothetical protein
MRRALILISVAAIAVACAKKEEAPPADTTTTAMAPAAAPAPAPLTEADVAGTWKGTSSPMTSDSVVSHWTQVCAAGKCTGTNTENKTTVHSTYTFSGDSSMGVSEPFAGPKGVKMIDHWTVHLSSGNATGTGKQTLASKPDSVVLAYKFMGSRQH